MAQRTLIFLAGLLWAAGASAQTTRVRGQVTDAADGKPLQFVSVVFPGTTTGITTDEQGIYALETRDTVSRVQASMVGYATRTLPLTPGTFNHVDFALEAVEFGIGQVVITPGENPAYPILDGVIRNKPLNDPERYDTQLPHLHQDGTGPHEHQAAVPEPPSPAQLRVRLRLR